ncbi:MAG: type IV secretory system conjugative DNA transfer family protein [Patescibacteria group bacterium]
MAITIAWLGLAIVFVWAFRTVVKFLVKNSSYFDHVIYRVRLPKEKPGEDQKEMNYQRVQKLHEEIAKCETLFAAIGGLRAQRWLMAWLFGRNDHFSFEIVAHKKIISFYMAAPRQLGPFLEQQIQAHFPEAIMEPVEDYNIFSPNSKIIAGYLRVKKEYIFPLKTYKKMEVDPLNTITNTLSKLEAEEGIAIQFIVRSAHSRWHKRARKVIRKVMSGKTIYEALHFSLFGSILSFAGDLAHASKPKINEENRPKRNSAMEEEILKVIEEKNSKSGLDANIRVIISSDSLSHAKIHLTDIGAAFSQYNFYEYGNYFDNKVLKWWQANAWLQNQLIRDFIFRRFSDRVRILLNSEELTSLFHLPLRWNDTPNIMWLLAKHAPAPANLPEEGIVVGNNVFRSQTRQIHLKRDDRRRHMYVIGKSGVGKSQFLAGLAIQDIINGEGVGVIDPHGDLVQDILARIPPERVEDVILFAPSDIKRPLALNLMEYDPRYPEQKTFVINEMIRIFDKLYDLKATGGPIFEQYMRNAMLLVMGDPESGSTLMEIPKVLADSVFRKKKLERCSDPTVVDFWKKEAEKAGGDAALANIVPYVTSKLTSFISNDMMRPIIGQQKSSFNLRDVMDRRKILLVDLSKGQIGEMNSFLLGMILVGKILMSALSRGDLPNEERKDFYLYIDEFHNFTTDSVATILSEARKYRLNLIMAHQYLGQLVHKNETVIKDAVFGNAGSWFVFKVGSEDAEKLVKEFEPVFNQYDLINVDKYTCYSKMLVDNTPTRPFSLKPLWPLPGIERKDLAGKIKALSRLKYGQDRHIIEAEIIRRVKIGA